MDDLLQAFFDDPVLTWAFPDPAKRRRHGTAYFRMHARRSIASGFAWATDGGAALWDPPHAWKTSAAEDLLLAARSVRGIGLRHGSRVVRGLLEVEKQHPSEEHLYLAVVGTRPDARGQGWGARLLAPGLQYADEHKLPCYLESSNPANLRFYERLGFETTTEHQVPDGPLVTLMWRPAH